MKWIDVPGKGVASCGYFPPADWTRVPGFDRKSDSSAVKNELADRFNNKQAFINKKADNQRKTNHVQNQGAQGTK